MFVHCYNNYRDVYTINSHYLIEQINSEFIVYEYTFPCNDLKWLSNVATLDIAISYIKAYERIYYNKGDY